MEEISVDTPAGVAGESGVSITNIEGRGGFEPFVDERDDRVATLGSLRTSLGLGYTHMKFGGASSGCDKDSWADASAPTPSWTGATESGQRGGDQGILGSLRVDEASALVDTMFIDLIRRVDCDVDSTSSAEAHAQGDPPRIGDKWLKTSTTFNVCDGHPRFAGNAGGSIDRSLCHAQSLSSQSAAYVLPL